MLTLILCGGRGARLHGGRPEPLMGIAGGAIVGDVISIYARQGFYRFLLLTGYKHAEIAAWAASADLPGSVECVDTGLDTPTGGRVHAVRDRIDGMFSLTYADGVADIDIASVINRVDSTGALAAMTV